MKNKAVQEVKYNRLVWVNKDMDELRKTECLCLNCQDMKSCLDAQGFYRWCVNTDIAFAVTRCPNFNAKEEPTE